MGKELTERDKFFYNVIVALNEDEERRGRGGLFYAAGLGCCLVWFGRSGWECKWYDLEYIEFPEEDGVKWTAEEDVVGKDKFFARAGEGFMLWKVIVNGAVKASFYDKEDAEKFVEKYGLVAEIIKQEKE